MKQAQQNHAEHELWRGSAICEDVPFNARAASNQNRGTTILIEFMK